MPRALLLVILASLFLTRATGIAFSNVAPDLERPQPFRHAINAVLGDASVIAIYGTAVPDLDADERVRTHLLFVHRLLSARDMSELAPGLQAARAANLARLSEYIAAGRFPKNHLYADQNRPCFIDRDGRICAVGYLIEQSAGRSLAEQINARWQSSFLWQMRDPALDTWVAESGMSLLELSMIQPQYLPNFNIKITPASNTAPTSVLFKGIITDEGSCGFSSVSIDYGDGTVQDLGTGISPYAFLVDLTHEYSTPGRYLVTCSATSSAWCGLIPATRSWIVDLGGRSLRLSVVQEGALTIHVRSLDPIPLDCLSSSTVAWGQYYGVVEGAGWFFDGAHYRTRSHTYPWRSQYTIQIGNQYKVGCADNATGTVVAHPSLTVAVQASTWGRVKSLFR